MATNWEYIKAAIDGDIDDGGAARESTRFYNINCPYTERDPRAKCKGVVEPTRDMCQWCKEEWLEAEYE